MRIVTVLALCAVGAVIAFRLLRPADDRPPQPTVTAASFDTAPLERALARQADRLRAVQAVGTNQLDALLTHDPLDLAIPRVTAEGVTATDVAIRRRGDAAAVEATVDLAQLAKLAPAEVSGVALDRGASTASEIVVAGTAKALGLSVPVSVRIHADDHGAIVAEPEGLPIGETVLFNDPRVRVRGLRATPTDDGRVRVRVTATVAG